MDNQYHYPQLYNVMDAGVRVGKQLVLYGVLDQHECIAGDDLLLLGIVASINVLVHSVSEHA